MSDLRDSLHIITGKLQNTKTSRFYCDFAQPFGYTVTIETEKVLIQTKTFSLGESLDEIAKMLQATELS